MCKVEQWPRKRYVMIGSAMEHYAAKAAMKYYVALGSAMKHYLLIGSAMKCYKV